MTITSENAASRQVKAMEGENRQQAKETGAEDLTDSRQPKPSRTLRSGLPDRRDRQKFRPEPGWSRRVVLHRYRHSPPA
jgi:hypothetical protein